MALWADRLGAWPALFSVKCLVAAMLAYYLALRIGLTRPYWAVTTSYIVAQPLAGAVLSKAAFRVAGTALGAAAAVILVPAFVNAPAALSLALALWLGLCFYISMLDRTPRAYLFLLAGYTASIIGFPSVDTPGAIFTVAIARVQEITLGILCGSLIHGTVFPQSVTRRLLQRIDTMLADSARWSRDALGGDRGERLARDRRRLALDVNELHQLSTHLPFDTARIRPRIRTVRALQDQVSLLLPLGSAVEDRILELERIEGGLAPPIAALVQRTQAWLDRGSDSAEGEALIAEAHALEPVIDSALDWPTALRLSLVARLADLIAAHENATALSEQVRSPTARAVSPAVARLLAATRRRVLHRDHGIALRSAAGTIATVLLGCAFWIATGWADGAGAVLIAGVCCALFGNADAPAPAVLDFLIGSIIGLAIAGVYAYAILPQVTGFPLLIAVLAPTLLLLGAFLGQPKTSFVTLGALLGVLNSMGLADRYTAGFASYVNGSLAQIVGTFFAVITVGLFQTIGTDRSVERIIRSGWRDLARRSDARGMPDAVGWNSRMLDRIGLLAPRLAARGEDAGQPVLDTLVDLRIGMVVAELRTLRLDAGAREAALITPVLAGVGHHYAGLDVRAPAPPLPALLGSIDRALSGLAADPAPDRRRSAVLALTSLRRNLFPAATGFAGGAA